MRTCFLLALAPLLLAVPIACSHDSPPVTVAEDPDVHWPPPSKGKVAVDEDPTSQDLEPVETRESYGARDPDPLLKDVDCEFSMVCMPSFTPAYAVALVSAGEDKPGEKLSERRWSIRFAADEPLKTQRIAKGDDPRRSADVELDVNSALRLRQAWESVVRRARYPRPRYTEGPNGERWESHSIGVDGTTYRFECGEYCGTTREPKAELTWGITELGEALRKYALLDEAARPAQLAHCLELATKLQAAAEKRPW